MSLWYLLSFSTEIRCIYLSKEFPGKKAGEQEQKMFVMEVRGLVFQGLLQNVLAKVILKWVTILNSMEKVSSIICVCNCICMMGMLWLYGRDEEMQK